MTSLVPRTIPSPVCRTLPEPAAAPPPPPAGTRAPREAGSSFTALTRQVAELGLMRRRYGYYWTKLVGAVVVLAVWVAGFVRLGDSWWQLVSAAVLGVVLTQVAFLGHDAAHRQIFRSGRWNDGASLVLANLFVGISYGWWRSKHTKHHSSPNKEGVDPDIALGAVAVTPAAATRSDGRLFRWLMAHQGWYFFPLLLLEGLSLHVEAVKRVAGRGKVERRALETTLLTLRLGGLLALVLVVLPPEKALVFVVVQLGVFGLYMGSAFAPNHIGMPLVSSRLKLDFLRRQVLMSRNISGGPLMSVFMGGLDLQVEHHLFPSVARPHLRLIAPLVRAHCAAEGVPYTQTTLWESYRSVVGYLNTVGLKGKDPFLCPLVAQRRAA
ncbi:Fatty acid desaturase [Microlunatus sagamiharensis]|uniref:Fatty acid desaturase n=1 Tax=Microlunatus sagamiharensis TaxID=546874 RepID=A0A1H2MF81_9ACTN|nr:acyl-CoA desaturase [Microlunatus sagamiharensis]SDU91849.1 Fatty acid desaturase [Microlunatus sagamiharensis]